MRPLTGLRVLAFEQYGAGPFGTQHLADLGADVIKIEAPATGGDYLRGIGPYFVDDDAKASDAGLFFQALNRNKRSLTLDITRPAGREVLHRLVETADATADNLRGDVPAKLKLTYADLAAIKPSIVCAHCSAYGRTGSRANWPGYDYLMQAEAGYFHLAGEPGTPPTRFGLSLVDYMGGQSLALGLVAGVMNARTTGKGRDVEIDLFRTALFNLNYLAVWALNSDYDPKRVARSAHPTMVPCQLYTTADGWIYLMCNKPSFWPVLCDLVERGDLKSDARLADFSGRLAHRDEVMRELDAALSKRTTAEWLALFQGRIPAAPVLTPREALNAPFFHERDLVETLTAASGTPFDVLKPAIDAGDGGVVNTAAPRLGADTDAILQDLGYDASERERLRGEKIV